MRLTIVLACTAALLSGQGRATTSGPLALHPDNPHYFLWRTKPAVLITSGEHYGALLNLDFDYRKYIDTLAADGMMLTRVFSGAYVEPRAPEVRSGLKAAKHGMQPTAASTTMSRRG